MRNYRARSRWSGKAQTWIRLGWNKSPTAQRLQETPSTYVYVHILSDVSGTSSSPTSVLDSEAVGG